VPTDYVELVRRAVDSGKQFLVIDEPAEPLSDERQLAVGHLLVNAVQQGRTVLTVMNPLNDNYIRL
jgi:ABC-type cobalamin transport system ATPase subunit